jgi:sugar O-acyltransferase (sialic acid O-acetyltransferase NeuD family)
MKDVVIVGAGGFGREVYNWAMQSLDSNSYKIKGFLSNDKNDLLSLGINLPILDDPLDYHPLKNDVFIFAIGISNSKISISDQQKNRKNIVDILKNKGAKFLTLVHKSVILSCDVVLGEGVILCPNVVLGHKASISDFSHINVNTSVGHNSVVGKFCVISPLCAVNGNAVLGEGCYLASCVHIFPKVNMARYSVVSSNTSVKNSSETSSFYYSNPAKIGIVPRL